LRYSLIGCNVIYEMILDNWGVGVDWILAQIEGVRGGLVKKLRKDHPLKSLKNMLSCEELA
jgi:hypothetical protein